MGQVMSETQSIDCIDLHRHTVIDASAGTGKTHTIEQIVLRLLVEEKIKIEHILVVTFTEKATSELKVRLRGMIERELRTEGGRTSAHLRAALDQFDLAPIFTIHGFCKRLSQDYILEQGGDFQPDVASDPELMRTLLHEVERKIWPAEFGDKLAAVLNMAGFDRDGAGRFERCILEIASRFRPGAEHQLFPAPVADWFHRLEETGANWAGQLEAFTIMKLHALLREYKKQRGLQSFDDMIADVDDALDPSKNPDAEDFRNVLRERYRYGIVDEFQDTDRLQWSIFRSIFLSGGASRLIVVGDPKQAIYAFRGSDLPTYHRAVTEMTSAGQATSLPLSVNWRSEPDLLAALNCLFGNGDWFPPGGKITYQTVSSPEEEKRLTRVENDVSGCAAMTIVDLTRHERLREARIQMARFTAIESRRLLNIDGGAPLLSIAHKGNPSRPLRAGDIAILVMTKAEAEPIMAALEGIGIPFSFYKQPGLWQTDEADHLTVLLQSLAKPDDRASFRKTLLTFFFRIRPQELALAPDLPSQHPARQLYCTWLAFVEDRQWSSLGRSLIEDTGLLFPGTEAERRPNLNTLRSLLAALELAAYESNLDLLGVLDWLRKLRAQRDRDDADVVPVEVDADKVQIMTIHAAKGLEFPIVFLAGGITQSSQWRGPVCFRDEHDRLVFDIGASEDGKARARDERLDEQRRLLYVALTRPILKLYVPKVNGLRGKQHAGPVASILAPALSQANVEGLGPPAAALLTPPLALNVPRAIPSPESPLNEPLVITGPLIPRLDRNMSKRRIFVRSFSSMARHHLSQIGAGASFGEETPRIVDENMVGVDSDDPLRGPVFGDIVHHVLESIDFAEVSRAATPADLCRSGSLARQCLDRMIQPNLPQLRSRTPLDQLEEAARRQIAHLVWHGLRTPLAAIGAPLCTILPHDRMHEVEFLFPERANLAEAKRPASEGFVTGFMDLLFRQNGVYYLLDWKTNLLSNYTPDAIAKSMEESDYHRQYRLYAHALERWLRQRRDRGFRFRDWFGGVYYLYLRGMNGRDESSGVFFCRPSEQDLQLPPLLQ